MTASLGLLVLFSVVSTGFLQGARQLSDQALGPFSTNTNLFWSGLPYVLPFLLSLLVFALAYRFGPGVPVMFRNIIPGAIFAALSFEILKNVFAFYVAHFRAYDIIYGSLGGILLFLTSVYVSAAILLAGGEIVLAMPLLRRETSIRLWTRRRRDDRSSCGLCGTSPNSSEVSLSPIRMPRRTIPVLQDAEGAVSAVTGLLSDANLRFRPKGWGNARSTE